MDIIQKLRRLGQQFQKGGWAASFRDQDAQIHLIKKLYLKHGLVIERTCSACPEQYDVFKDGKQVAYYRLRHGEFRVDFPECGGETIYEADPNGDGCFDASERIVYLTKALRQLVARL